MRRHRSHAVLFVCLKPGKMETSASCGWKGGYLKQKRGVFLAVLLSLSFLFSVPVYAVGDGNIDGGGGNMGQGTSQNSWSPGNEGVRVTVIRAEGHEPVTRPIDLTNKQPKIVYSFGKVSKMSYTKGSALTVDTNPYEYVNPAQSLPRIISSKSLGQANIEEIKSYFTDEQVVRSIAGLTGMDFDTLVGGEYRLLLEPISFLKFQGTLIAATATEAALYDEMLSGGMRAVLPTVAFQNLPLSMFLETPDLGYPAWGGPTSGVRSNSEIKSSLGLGVVRFHEAPPEEPEISTYDYEYRTNTEVITAVEVSGGQSDPDDPVSVTFSVGGKGYRVGNACYGRLTDNIRVKVNFQTGGIADHYDRLKVTLLNRNEGIIDSMVLTFQDVLGIKKTSNPNFRDGVNPHIWSYGRETKWYVYQPGEADYKKMSEAVNTYLEVFKEPVETMQMGQRME